MFDLRDLERGMGLIDRIAFFIATQKGKAAAFLVFLEFEADKTLAVRTTQGLFVLLKKIIERPGDLVIPGAVRTAEGHGECLLENILAK